ncbi:alkyl/aryl-sulfatase [Rhabdothermincola salaria]|uniref:alkyl/aryl-sulfatase n=1 Tax=Rhabdothermincola salaria TaxID=2903142 RepID=UPI001E6051B1|nr:alkyl sulfatase dimerization domain-containing protein [Rhabdothermincola salaria]MCD9624818.1 MBL fold metallo-hydrolase [Rhabdothermincola salaria]
MSASEHVARANAAVRLRLPFHDDQDFVDAGRGLVARLDEPIVTATDGRVVWDLTAYGDLSGDAPDTVNPSLWRQAQLDVMHGLFEIAPGFYQVRGLDLSNMTIVEGDEGVIVIDPLISNETAAAALALYRSVRGDRPVTALLYTHSHVDHFGGARGVLPDGEPGDIPIVAPEHFLDHAISENLTVGPAMARRAAYMYGAELEKGPTGQMTSGLGPYNSTGTTSLVPPTVDITHTGQELVLDGVRLRFQMTPGTEAPAEMNFHFPDHRILCMAENATHNLHNVVTLRGAQVRDARAWSRFLDESLELFGADTDLLFASHHWPTWGTDRAADFLAEQRDLYGYLHDQSVRMLNQGLTATEIAEELVLPPSLEQRWHTRGYYGSLSHNAKAVYQRYMGWFDANPARLWPHPPTESAPRYVEYMGGADAVLERARQAFDDGDLRWVAEVVNHVVFADPSNREARELQATAFEQLAYGAENAVWRNFYLMGARELREGPVKPEAKLPLDMLSRLTTSQILDTVAVRIDGPRAWDSELSFNLSIGEAGERHVVRLRNGVLTHVAGRHDPSAQATVVLADGQLLPVLLGLVPLTDLVDAGTARVDGDITVIDTLRAHLVAFDPAFPIVEP